MVAPYWTELLQLPAWGHGSVPVRKAFHAEARRRGEGARGEFIENVFLPSASPRPPRETGFLAACVFRSHSRMRAVPRHRFGGDLAERAAHHPLGPQLYPRERHSHRPRCPAVPLLPLSLSA